ncbi:type II toxin-antitoxin system mRNA interferase toxin, RelE/StbE family [Candidatus Parvarchaeota archaeon]|nr:type II toxin-antitoxin system mRNA interferase toxin, RelE/StbE family [Candidatus Parvarchaeota archaeon]
MFHVEFSKELTRKLEKIKKKDHELFEATIKKIREIEKSPFGYKPLRYTMVGYYRVHILKSFVLTFKIDNSKQTITFEDLDHHDKIYSN